MRSQDTERNEIARKLRRHATRAEMALWARLRDRQLSGLKFVRQRRIGGRYVDFVCRQRRLVVEIDGGQHADRAADRRRDEELDALGCRVLRFWNNDVLGNIEGVLQCLEFELANKPLTLTLSPQRGEREPPEPSPSPREAGRGPG